MKVAYCSDLHLDTYPALFGFSNYPQLLVDADILIIAGDIAEYINYHRYNDLFDTLSNHYKHVILVSGNHEYYNSDIKTIPSYLPNNFRLLNNRSVEIDGHIFYGGNCWSDLRDESEQDQKIIQDMINDFHIISNGNRKFTTHDCTDLFNEFFENLIDIEVESNKPYTVISHFPPSKKSIHDMFKDSNLNSYFVNDLDSFIETSNIGNWVCGHVHHIHEYVIGNTHIRCNPRGYPRERMNNNDYTPYISKIFEV